MRKRPDFYELIKDISQAEYFQCICGQILGTIEQVLVHWEAGHLDYEVTPKNENENMQKVEDTLRAENARLRAALEQLAAITDDFPFAYRQVFEEIGLVDYPSINLLHKVIKTLGNYARAALDQGS